MSRMAEKRESEPPLTADDVRARVDVYVDHLRKIEQVFNEHAHELGLGVRLNASGAVEAAMKGAGIARVMRFCDRPDDSGVLHGAQLMTAIDCIGELLTAPQKNGLVLGAMQSGKTTTSLAFQFAGPIVHLLTGRCLYPIYLITSHTSQEDQTKIEITRFLDFYGELSVEVDEENHCRIIDYLKFVKRASIDPVFAFSPTINTYREHVLKYAFDDTMMGPRLEDFIQRRAPGESIRRIADLCRRANEKGFSPLLIIDEPQFGASDRFVKVEDGVERRPCVLLQIFRKIDDAIGGDEKDRVFVGLSATPYELADIEAVWRVEQYLTSEYTGFNYFGGKVIDDEADVNPPKTISFGDFGREIGVPFLEHVSLNVYGGSERSFERFARKNGYFGTQSDYQSDVEGTLRDAILHMARNGAAPNCGICIRLFNNNIRSRRLIKRLDLPADEIDVIEYFGSRHKGQSVKRAIRQRSRPDLPFLVVVTNRARMGDAFPGEVEWFLEFSKKAATLNALLQGLLGRACGYGKRSTVVMSAENAELVEDYKRAKGDYIYKTSPHSLVVGPFRRGAPTSLVRVFRDMDDPCVQRFFEQIDREIVDLHVIQGSPALRAHRASKGKKFRTGPLLRIAEKLNLFEYLESDDVRRRLFPTYPEFRIARANDKVPHSRAPDEKLGYSLDENGDCRFTFREWTGNSANHGGARSRGYGGRDATDRARAGNTLEPQINMRKFDPSTGEVIDDKRLNGEPVHREDRRPGNWRAEMVTLPLVGAVRELQPGEVTYPVKHSPFSKYMSLEERERAGFV